MSFTPSGGNEVEIEISAEDNASDAFRNVEGSAMDMKTAVAGAGAIAAGAGAAGLAASAQAAADFEQAMVEVEKVTSEATAEEMAGSIKDMASEIPMAQEELAALAADAGRFGIEGSKNIEAFTETTAKMASATTLNADQASESLAKLSELTNTPISEVENLGSSINTLSNNYATSSQEIVDSMMRSAGAMSQLGMSQTEIAGMSAAINEVSESSERAGTRMRRLSQELMNPKKTEKLASALGMSTEEFAQMREEAPNDLMMQMAESMANGGDQADALRQSLSTTSRQALSGLAQNLEGARGALEESNKAYEEGSSLQEEFQKDTETFNKQLELLTNQIENLKISIGEQLLPVLTDLLDAVSPALDAFIKFNEQFDGMPAVIALVGTTLAGLGVVAATVGPVIVGALSPILAPIAAIAAAVGVLYYAWTNNMGGIQQVVKNAWDTISTALNGVLKVFKQVFDQYLLPLLKRLAARFKKHFQEIMQEAVPTMRFIGEVVQSVLRAVSVFWDQHGNKIMTIVETVFAFLELTIGTVMHAIATTIQVVLALIRGDWEAALTHLKDFWTTTLSDIWNYLKGAWLKGIKATFKLFFGFIKDIFGAIYDFLIGGSIVPKTFNAIKQFISQALSDIIADFKQFFVNLATVWYNGLTTIANWLASTGASFFQSAFGSIADAITGVIDNVVGYIKDTFGRMVDWIMDTIGDAVSNAIETFNRAIPSRINIPTMEIGGGSIDVPSVTVAGETIGGGDLDIPSETIGGGSLNLPQLAQGGIITDDTLARVGEAGQPEAVVPLDRLTQFLDTAYEVGAQTAPTGTQSAHSASNGSSLTATLRVEGDGELAELIRENAELVVEERDREQSNRIARM